MTESYYPIIEADDTHRWASMVDGTECFEENGIRYVAHDGLVETEARGWLTFRLYIHPRARFARLGPIFAADPERAELWAQTWRPA